MNVWAIDKEQRLKVLLIELVHRYGENIILLDNSIQHFQAIEIFTSRQPKLRAYIYTFGQCAGHYGIDLKYPIATHNIIGENEDQSLEQILSILTSHLFS
ncbi:hypothetical protein BAC3_01307 [uncultured bacterium]|nr:hypothetical protein BAC3_01296 [uncultured bacterium]CAG1770757.1 hypothetical protein BAC3_01307 [uncultured bacterium]